MRYFYRVRTHETKSQELPEVPIRTSPTITTCQPLTDVPSNVKTTENIISDKNREISSTEKPQADTTTTTTPVINSTTTENCVVKNVNKCISDSSLNTQKPKKSEIKVKIDGLKKQIVEIQKINGKLKSVCEQSNKNCDSVKIKSDKLDKVKCGKVKKDKDEPPKIENLKLKFDLSKQNSVSIIKSGLNDSFNSKSDKKDKTNGKKSPTKDKKSTSPKDKKLSPINDKKSPKIILNLSKIEKSEKSEKSNIVSTISRKIHNFELCKIKVKDDKQLLASDKPKSFHRVNSISSLNMSLEDQMEEQKSEFLNSFELTARKSLSPAKTPITTPSQTVPKITLSKRKNKEPMKNILKRNRYSDEEDMKDIVEYKIKEDKPISPVDNKLTFSLSPFPIGSLNKETFVKPPTPNGSDKRSPKEKDSGKFKVPKTESFSSFHTPPRVDTPRPISNAPPLFPSTPVTSMKPPQIPPARKLTPILPKAKKDTDLSKLVRKIEKEVIKNKVVYGPGMDPSTLIQSYSKPNQNYLNYALMNSANKTDPSIRGSSTPYGNRTPRYAPNSPSYSPIYSPNSPQYNPNYNIPTQPQFKYIKSAAYVTNYLQNLLTKDKCNDESSSPPLTTLPKTISPPPPPPPIFTKPIVDKKETIVPKRSTTSPNSIDAPPEKQKKVQSLLDSCNMKFPSSLSITLATEEDEPSSNTSSFNPKRNSPVNNFIEIVKLSGSGGGSTGGIGGGISTNDDDKNKQTVLGKTVNGEGLLSKVIEIKNKLNEENKLKANELSNNNNIDVKADTSKKDSYQLKFLQSILHQEKMNDSFGKLFPNEPTKIRGSPSPPQQPQFVAIAPKPDSKVLTPPHLTPTSSNSLLKVNQNVMPLTTSLLKKPAVKKVPNELKAKKEKPIKKVKSDGALDLSSSIPNNNFTSPKSSPHEITPDMQAYVNEMARMAQNSRFMIPQMPPNNYMPNYNLNMQNVQQLMMMEQYTRMQKAGAEAIMENYVQNCLKKASERKEV